MAKQNVIQVPDANGNVDKLFIDVELRGKVVPLVELKRALRRTKNVNQTQLASMTAKYNGGKELHQTSVSGYLSGKVEMHGAVVAVLEELFTDAELEQMAQSSTNAQAASSGNNRMPSFARTLDSIPGPDNRAEGVAPVQAASGAQAGKNILAPFPEDNAFKLMGMVRRAQKAEEISCGFSTRQMIMWASAYMILQAEGFTFDEALSGSFHLAVEGKSYGEDKAFLQNAFNMVFGFESKPPVVNKKKKAARDENRHPMEYIVEPLVRACKPVWFHGPKGCGKTYSAVQIAKRLGRPYIRVQGKPDMTAEDLVGSKGAQNASTYFEYGPLPKMMQEGGILIFDEPTITPSEVTMRMQAVLEGEPLVLTENGGEVIHPKEGFTIIFCDNTLGLGERSEYIGTNVMNDALRDRFLFVEYDYMPEAQERVAVRTALAEFSKTQGWMVAA